MLTLFIILMWSFLPAHASSQAYPTKPVEVIVPFAAGGTIEIATRIINNVMSELLGQPVVIITKPGAGGAIGADYVAKAKPDGYVILSSSNSANVVSPAININTPYTINDFRAIGQYAKVNNILIIPGTSEFKTAQELIKYAKENPGKLTYGTGGVGATTFMCAELFKKATGIKVEHVPFKGDANSVTAVAGGHVDFCFVTIGGALGQLDAKKIKALAVFGSKRDPQLADVPTVSEIGYPKATFQPWLGYFVPKGTPEPIVSKISSTFNKMTESPSVKEQLKNVGCTIEYVDGKELQRRIEEEYKIYRELAVEGNFLIK
jgi:tripartite-type tricarboxylate transporter receptor subunit TctC